MLARYGGEEFVIVLPDADPETVLEIAERCRRAVAEVPVRLHVGTRITVTGSFGGACLPDHAADVDTLIRLADRALYAAKDDGRHRTHLAGSDTGAAGGPDQPDSQELPAGVAALLRIADLVDARLGTTEHSAAMAR